METIVVTEEDKLFAKKQIEEFEKMPFGTWRYQGVEAWRGIVCEMLVSKWLGNKFTVHKMAKGLDTSGICDEYDLIINNKKIEIKSATKNYFKHIMPKIHDLTDYPKDIYIGVKYNETVEPNEVIILGYMDRDRILKYPKDQDKGAPYYKVPQADFLKIDKETFN